MEVTQRVRNHRIPSRPHLQGDSAPLRLRHSAREVTDGGGLVVLRRLWDRWEVGSWLDRRAAGVAGHYRPSLMVEAWAALLFYGGGWMDDLALLAARGVRRLFGWERVPDPTTFGRWLRRAGPVLVPALDELLWRLVRLRWREAGVPERLTLVLDSTVAVRYGNKQAGAEVGYNPTKPGRPGHHPLLAFCAETGDSLGVRWRPGSAWAGEGAAAWIEALVGRLRAAGVGPITVRLDKGFFAKRVVRTLQRLGVSYFLKVPNHQVVRNQLGTWHRSVRAEGIFEGAQAVWTSSGSLWGGRLLSLQGRRPLAEAEGTLALDTYEVVATAHVLTDREGIHALTAWRAYNRGAVVELRIKELGQLQVGRTAVDDLGGNALLWSLGALAYQLLHTIRSRALSGPWRRATPDRLRAWLFRLPGRLTRHARKTYLQLRPDEPLRARLLQALRRLGRLRAPPLPAAG